VACSGFGACAHDRRLVRVYVAVGQRDLRAVPPPYLEAAALPEIRNEDRFQKVQESAAIGALNMGGAGMVLRFGSPLGLCAHVLTSYASFEWMLQLVSETVVIEILHIVLSTPQPPTIKRPPPCRRNGARIGSVARKVLPSGRRKPFREMAGARVLIACGWGFGACAHPARPVRVDVALGELQVAVDVVRVDVEAAALPEK
jgi:hypothetical protein